MLRFIEIITETPTTFTTFEFDRFGIVSLGLHIVGDNIVKSGTADFATDLIIAFVCNSSQEGPVYSTMASKVGECVVLDCRLSGHEDGTAFRTQIPEY